MANTPENTFGDENLRTTIWKSFGDNGNFFTVTLTRTYKDDGGDYHGSNSFSGAELLGIAHLAERAYDAVGELRRRDAQ